MISATMAAPVAPVGQSGASDTDSAARSTSDFASTLQAATDNHATVDQQVASASRSEPDGSTADGSTAAGATSQATTGQATVDQTPADQAAAAPARPGHTARLGNAAGAPADDDSADDDDDDAASTAIPMALVALQAIGQSPQPEPAVSPAASGAAAVAAPTPVLPATNGSSTADHEVRTPAIGAPSYYSGLESGAAGQMAGAGPDAPSVSAAPRPAPSSTTAADAAAAPPSSSAVIAPFAGLVASFAPNGAAASSPTAGPANAPTVAPDSAQELVGATRALVGQGPGGSTQLVLRLDPPGIGNVSVRLISRGGEVNVAIRADSVDAIAGIAAVRDHVASALGRSGLALGEISISRPTAGSQTGTATQSGGDGDQGFGGALAGGTQGGSLAAGGDRQHSPDSPGSTTPWIDSALPNAERVSSTRVPSDQSEGIWL